MRQRPLFWFAVSLLCFLGAYYCWELGDEWAARRAGAAATVSRPQADAPVQQGSLRQLARPGARGPAVVTNLGAKARIAYRLSNTTQSYEQLLRNPKAVLLENTLLDTAQPVNLPIPAFLRAQGAPGAWLVQARKPLDDAFRLLLAQAGASIVSYIPNNAYLVRASEAVARQLEAAPATQAVLPYEPYYKLKSWLLRAAVEQAPLPADCTLRLLLFADARDETLGQLGQMGIQVLGEQASPFGPVLEVSPPAAGQGVAAELAQLAGVQELELAQARLPANDLSRATTGVAADSVTQTNYLNLSGSNVLVAMVDSGVDATHPDLASRVLGDFSGSLVDTSGHGTHVAGIIAGNGTESTTVTNAQGSGMPGTNGQFRGKAPAAKLFSMTGGTDYYLQEMAARTNALISNNSWTYADNDYDLAAASYDAAVRDALPEVPGAQPVLFVFATGNNGTVNVYDDGSDDNGQGGSAGTILSPATAKNVITVGAIEQFRQITNATSVCIADPSATNGLACSTNEPWLPSTDSGGLAAGFQVAKCSGRGNVGLYLEGNYGRFKPDVVAPGTFVVSTRSSQWDQAAYYNPTSYLSSVFTDAVVDPGSTNLWANEVYVPATAVGLTISLVADSASPVPFPELPIFVSATGFAASTNYAYLGTNEVSVTDLPPGSLGATWYYAVGNTTTQAVTFDVQTLITVTNYNGNFFQVLSNMNDALGTGQYYRYESGTSMSAADVSGMLALMQEFFQRRLGRTNSPALMKALLINGARSLGTPYDFCVTNEPSYQGWGLVDLPTTLQGSLTNPGAAATSMLLFDQSPTNALATGQSLTRTFSVSSNAQSQGVSLRATLVWTDPPGNPVAGVKLVNNLQLIMTNVETGEVFYGNDIQSGNTANLPWNTNTAPNQDLVNNVQNVFLGAPLGTNYSVTVVGQRVNVNALSASLTNVAQDYALVISCGDGQVTNALTLTQPGLMSAVNVPDVSTVANEFTNAPAGSPYAAQGGLLLGQHVGASSPMISSNTVGYPSEGNAVITLGVTNQWHFYMVTNTPVNGVVYTNAVFMTFSSLTLALPRMGVTNTLNPTNATEPEPNLDLYVSTNAALTNLDAGVVSNAWKSVGLGGDQTIILSNAVQGVYYAGVKSEDQLAAEYGFLAMFSLNPPEAGVNGNPVIQGYPINAAIPDGTPQHPGVALIFGVAASHVLVHRVIVTNVITHQLVGDLLGTLGHGGSYVVLNNHDTNMTVINWVNVYDDSDMHNIPGAHHTDGPGSLMNFAGKAASGQWLLNEVDNAATHVGTNNFLSIYIEKQQSLTAGLYVNLLPGACDNEYLEVPSGATNLIMTATVVSNVGPIDVTMELCPDTSTGSGCKSTLITNQFPTSLSIGQFDVPPLAGGTYYVRLCNRGVGDVSIFVKATIEMNNGAVAVSAPSSAGPVKIQNDAVTYADINVTNHMMISDLDVGLLISDPRVSGLAITLISPNGTRVVLFQNRGGTSTNGLGTFQPTSAGGLPVFSYTGWPPFWTNNFNTAAAGLYGPGAVFEGWTVLTNEVKVFPDYSIPWFTNNFLILGEGAVSNSLPTTNSSQYQLTFRATHAPYLAGMVSWWPLDGNANDIFGGLNGLLYGDVAFTNGEVAQAFYGDGVATKVVVPASPRLALPSKFGLTVEGWVNPANITNRAPLVEWFDPTATNGSPLGVQLWLGDLGATNVVPGGLSAALWDTSSQPHYVFTRQHALTNGGWQHVALTFDASTLRANLYVNGRLANAQFLPAGTVLRTNGNVYLGFDPGSPARSYAGGLDEVSVYDRALSAQEVLAIYNTGHNGKYGTNALTCPVAVQVSLATGPGGATSTTYTFTNGLDWATNGLSWETNTISFTNVLLFASTNGPATNFTPIILTPLDPNVTVDDFVLSSLTTNYQNGLMYFSDNTNLAVTPIKFAPAPYVLSNSPPALVFSNSFALASGAAYATGATIGGLSNSAAIGARDWTVVAGPVTVASNALVDAVNTNFLVLATGAVQAALPTVPGQRYQLSYTLRGPGAVSWWNGATNPLDGRLLDLIGGNDGALINGAASVPAPWSFVGNQGIFLPGMLTNGVAGSPYFGGNIQVGDPPNLRLTNGLTIEGWLNPSVQTNKYVNSLGAFVEQVLYRGDSRECAQPYYLALQRASAGGGPQEQYDLVFHIGDGLEGDCGVSLETSGHPITTSNWWHIAAVFQANYPWAGKPLWPTNMLRLYVNGVYYPNVLLVNASGQTLATSYTGEYPFADLDPAYSPGVAIGNASRANQSQPYFGFMDELSVYGRALTDAEIAAIYAAGSAGKADLSASPAQSLAKMSVSLDNVQMDVANGDNGQWDTGSFLFTAQHTNTLVMLQGLLPGTLVDSVALTAVPSQLYYQPENSLAPLLGTDAYGTWTLEIQDTDYGAGAATNLAQLVTWQLDFQLLPSNPPPVIELTHGLPYTNTLGAMSVQDFIVQVPLWATNATNVLLSALDLVGNPQPMGVLYNAKTFPTSTANALVWPAADGPQSRTLATNAASQPLLLPGKPYYLTVTNPNAAAVRFAIGVWFDILSLANCETITNAVVGPAGVPRYFQFDVPTNGAPPGLPQNVAFWLGNASTNLTVVLSQHLPLPDLGQYDYLSRQPGPDAEIVMVVDNAVPALGTYVIGTNSTPWPIETNRWYAGVFNSAPTNVSFAVQACYSTNYPAIIPLTNGVPYTPSFGSPYAAAPGAPRTAFFRFEITNVVDGVLFELYNLTGDADLVLQRDVPPTMAPYFAGSFQPGLVPEQIVVRTSAAVPDLRGYWYLGVYNDELAGDVRYTLRATLPVNGVLQSALPLVVTNQYYAPGYTLLSWYSVVGNWYTVSRTDNVSVTNAVASVLATTPLTTWLAPTLPPGTGSYIVVPAPAPVQSSPSLAIQLWAHNQVRISWPTNYQGFTLQYSLSLTPPAWVNLSPPAPVGVEGADYVFYDAVSTKPKYYRLVQ